MDALTFWKLHGDQMPLLALPEWDYFFKNYNTWKLIESLDFSIFGRKCFVKEMIP